MRATRSLGFWVETVRRAVLVTATGRVTAVAAIAVAGSVSLSGCGKKATEDDANSQPATGNVGMPNPASVHCIKENGKLEIRKGPGGGEYGMCVFKDGSECDEWKLFRGECKPGSHAGEAPPP
jgi:putative hemolysin